MAHKLDEAIAAWLQLADDEDRMVELGLDYGGHAAFRFRADTYRRTAKALQWEKDTGEAVCSCCFKPLKQYRSRIFADWDKK
jgi:xanthine dehydrogenase iron-sulfur cluster and FAD-binding subunit A